MAPAEKGIPEPETALTPVKRLLWAWARRGTGLILCLGAWTVSVFLVYDSALRWLAGGESGRAMTGVLAFPFSLLAVAGALALTVRLVRRWAFMGETLPADPGPVDKDGARSYLYDSAPDPHSKGR